MSKELDPEVLADIQQRDRDARSRTPHEHSMLSPVIGVVPCRGRCGRVVEWTQEAEDTFAMFCAKLLRDREAPLDKTRTVFCIPCRDKGRTMAAASNRKHIDALADVVKRIVASSNPDGERELLARARELKHPDVEGMLQALRDKRMAKGGKRGGL